METDDPITRVTKYQTHLIMLADKLATAPDSAKTAAQTDSLARATAALLQGLASTEAKEDTARAAVTAAAASVKIAREASNDNDDLAEHVAGLDVVAKVLEEKIENFSAKP